VRWIRVSVTRRVVAPFGSAQNAAATFAQPDAFQSRNSSRVRTGAPAPVSFHGRPTYPITSGFPGSSSKAANPGVRIRSSHSESRGLIRRRRVNINGIARTVSRASESGISRADTSRAARSAVTGSALVSTLTVSVNSCAGSSWSSAFILER